MWQKVTEAIEQKNFTQAQQLLQQYKEEDIDGLWTRYYSALIEETQENWEIAEAQYRQIIRDSIYPNPKLITKIRDGIERILIAKKQPKKQVITQLEVKENNEDLAVLVLEAIDLEEKKLLAPQFAKIMEIDRYTATLQIPTRSWRLYKTGNYGKLSYYHHQLSQANIPSVCQTIKEINQIKVYQVKYIQSALEELILVCETDSETEETINLQITEINHRVEAIIPLFESTVHIDAKGKMQKKQSTLDYAKFYDLHIHKRNLILRFSDYFYEFEQGVNFLIDTKTASEKWKNLVNFFATKINHASLHSDFTLFAESLVQFPEMLKQVKSRMQLFRREETVWDEAFQLYSGLVFLRFSLDVV